MEQKKEYSMQEIADYIIKTYPDSCMAENTLRLGNPLSEGIQLAKDCWEFFYYEKLNWCGCGDPESATEAAINLLKCFEDFDHRHERMQEYFECNYVYDNVLLLCLAYTLDAAGFTDHGTGIGGSWLTDEGYMFICCAEVVLAEENDDEESKK